MIGLTNQSDYSIYHFMIRLFIRTVYPNSVFSSFSIIKTIMFKYVQLQQQQQKRSFNIVSYYSKKINEHGKKIAVKEEDIIIISTTPEISTIFSPIGRNVSIPQTHHFSERKKDHNWKSCGQHNSSDYQPQPTTDSSYYQPKLASYSQRQQYCQDRIIQQDRSKNGYDRDKMGKHGNIHSGIPTPDQKQLPIISLRNNSYARKKNPTDSSLPYFITQMILLCPP